jgi:hypothetical protein
VKELECNTVSKHLTGVGTVSDICHIIKCTWISTFDNVSQDNYLFTQMVLPSFVARWRDLGFGCLCILPIIINKL